MKKFRIKELSDVIDGDILFWDEEKVIEYFIEQPDDPIRNCLYFLFEGFDDEDDLLQSLIDCNASGVVIRAPHGLNISKWKKARIGVIEVESITPNYLELAKLYRSQFDIPFIQVVGSSGKTTTKEIIGSVINAQMPALVGWKNYNAPSGVAYNIFSLRKYHRAAVLEVGMKAPGIMSLSSKMVKPHIGVLTSIQRAHFASMGSIENIIEAKAEIFEHLDENGIFIVNGEDENCRRFPLNRFKGKVLTVGFSGKFDLWASDLEYKNFKTYFKVNGRGLNMNCVINTIGRYNVINALSAILVGLELGIHPESIKKGLSSFKTLSGRLKIYNGSQGTILVNDNFNANPDSTKQLLDEVNYFSGGRPLILVLGDMERPDDEIKEYAKEIHYNIGEQLSKINFNYLVAIGRWSKQYVAGAMDNGVSPSKLAHFDDIESAEEHFKSIIIPGSVIVFKASVYVPVRHLIRTMGVNYD